MAVAALAQPPEGGGATLALFVSGPASAMLCRMGLLPYVVGFLSLAPVVVAALWCRTSEQTPAAPPVEERPWWRPATD